MTAPICLLTRPEAQSRDLAAELPGVDCLISPVLRIAPVDFDADRVAAAPGLIFTSVNAVPFAGRGRGRPALCVGPQTARAAREAGFSVIEGPGDADGLLPLLADRQDWLHLHGIHRACALPAQGLAVYDQVAQALDATALRAISGSRPLILPLFSPRSAALLSARVAAASAPITTVAISPATDAAYTGPVRRRRIAARPARDAMRDAIIGALS